MESCHGLAYAVVMDLLDSANLLEEGRILYVDNFYSSLILFEDLYQQGTFASGTMRTNCKHYPSKDLDEGVQPKGDMFFKYHGPITAGKWRDKRDENFLSALFHDEKEDTSRRGADDQPETVSKPNIITDHNKNMSGVDIYS